MEPSKLLQFVAALPAVPHPQLDAIERDVASSQVLLDTSLTPLRSKKTDHFIGAGRAYQATVTPSKSSAYGFNGPVHVELYLPEPYSTNTIPALRVVGMFQHAQVREDGFVAGELIEHNRSLQQQAQTDVADNPIAGTLQLFESMLRAAVPEPLTDLDTMSLAQLLQLWQQHDPKCTCIINQAMPCTWAQAAQLSAEERQTQLLAFQANLHQRHQVLFSIARDHFYHRMSIIAEWQSRTRRPELYNTTRGWPEAWFDPSFWQAIQRTDRMSALRDIAQELVPGIYSFDMLSDEFCDLLTAELADYEASNLPKSRPNSMNRYGMILSEMGMSAMLTKLMKSYLQPVIDALMPTLAQGQPMDHHHSFVVQYERGHDIHLDMHTDDSEFTCNVNLVDTFTGSGLSFCGMHGSENHRKLQQVYQHKRGRAVVHAGMHRHGADPLLSGRRENLIVWCRSSAYRQTADFYARYKDAYLAEEAPDERCLSRTHDRDFGHWSATFASNAYGDDQQPIKSTNPDYVVVQADEL
eukprot:TRINITY_DN4398_c0_g1_i1.p1 TRINITY_DN4398_c0_g1~~TRINITY_DN4398_c0_g1_i1.p1  ORF type:complete len:609 (+),score=132.19 TRINITY_DN4398_c0_g1_i1:257-1828(+)